MPIKNYSGKNFHWLFLSLATFTIGCLPLALRIHLLLHTLKVFLSSSPPFHTSMLILFSLKNICLNYTCSFLSFVFLSKSKYWLLFSFVLAEPACRILVQTFRAFLLGLKYMKVRRWSVTEMFEEDSTCHHIVNVRNVNDEQVHSKSWSRRP